MLNLTFLDVSILWDYDNIIFQIKSLAPNEKFNFYCVTSDLAQAGLEGWPKKQLQSQDQDDPLEDGAPLIRE